MVLRSWIQHYIKLTVWVINVIVIKTWAWSSSYRSIWLGVCLDIVLSHPTNGLLLVNIIHGKTACEWAVFDCNSDPGLQGLLLIVIVNGLHVFASQDNISSTEIAFWVIVVVQVQDLFWLQHHWSVSIAPIVISVLTGIAPHVIDASMVEAIRRVDLG